MSRNYGRIVLGGVHILTIEHYQGITGLSALRGVHDLRVHEGRTGFGCFEIIPLHGDEFGKDTAMGGLREFIQMHGGDM